MGRRPASSGSSGCYAFTPNAAEAMAYTRTTDPADAARTLAEHVPLVVVTLGADGALAVEGGREVRVESLDVDAIDATGAGDVFAAALVTGTLQRLAARAAAALRHLVLGAGGPALRRLAGRPGLGRHRRLVGRHGGDRAHRRPSAARATADRYEFLTDVLPGRALARVRRADATIARLSDAQQGTTAPAAPTLRTS